MSDITLNMIRTFKAALPGFNVYDGTIPENAIRPAIAIYNVAFTNERVLEGKKTKNTSVWRITLSDSVVDLQNSINAILLLDNTVNEYFQRLFIDLTLIEPKVLTEPYKRAFFDVSVYPK